MFFRGTIAVVGAVCVAAGLLAPAAAAGHGASLTGGASHPFGAFDGVPYVRHTGIFEGETSLGAFRMPYEIVAPEDPALGDGTLLFEPPHFAFAPLGRDLVLTRGFLFGQGYSYAAVGYGNLGQTILDPTAPGLIIAGTPVGSIPTPLFDEEIIVQYVHALSSDPDAVAVLGEVERRYAYGISQTGDALLETLHSAGGPGLFDLTLLHVTQWNPPARPPGVVQNLPDEFQPLSGVGRVLFLETEGDLLLSDTEQIRRAANDPDYRVYEVAGAAHWPLVPPPLNSLDHFAVARALLVAGDAWVREGTAPPSSTLLEDDASGEIARDGDGNALGGVRLPDLAVGRGQYIASIPIDPLGLGILGLVGLMVDLACAPEAGSTTGEPRFRSHGDYVGAFSRATNELRKAGFLLDADANALKEQASMSTVGKPRSCPD